MLGPSQAHHSVACRRPGDRRLPFVESAWRVLCSRSHDILPGDLVSRFAFFMLLLLLLRPARRKASRSSIFLISSAALDICSRRNLRRFCKACRSVGHASPSSSVKAQFEPILTSALQGASWKISPAATINTEFTNSAHSVVFSIGHSMSTES